MDRKHSIGRLHRALVDKSYGMETDGTCERPRLSDDDDNVIDDRCYLHCSNTVM